VEILVLSVTQGLDDVAPDMPLSDIPISRLAYPIPGRTSEAARGRKTGRPCVKPKPKTDGENPTIQQNKEIFWGDV